MSWGTAPGSVRVEGEADWVRKPTPPGKRLTDQIVVVTGASRGFGRLIALAAADEGANVVVNYSKSSEAAEEIAATIRNKGRESLVVQADVSEDAEVRAMVERVQRGLGPVEILVNNAGWARVQAFDEKRKPDYEAIRRRWADDGAPEWPDGKVPGTE